MTLKILFHLRAYRMRLKIFTVICLFVLLAGCGFSDYRKKSREREANAIEVVKKAPGSTAKTDTLRDGFGS